MKKEQNNNIESKVTRKRGRKICLKRFLKM